jgi:hypothetical protein
MPTPNLERPIQMIFRVSERERKFIYKKMKIAKTKNKTAYLRKMAVDGYILNVDFSEFREMFANIGSISRNVNVIVKRINSTDRVYSEDIAEIKSKVEEIWDLLKIMLSKLPNAN